MLDGILDIIQKFIPDESEAKRLEAQVLEKHINAVEKVKQEQASIIKAEQITGAGKWRPRMMYVCMTMISTHFVLSQIIPFIITIFDINVYYPEVADLSPELWSFLKMGIGGYIGSRGLEKMVKEGIQAWRRK